MRRSLLSWVRASPAPKIDADHTISGRESGLFKGLRRHFGAARLSLARDGLADRDAPFKGSTAGLTSTGLRRVRGAPGSIGRSALSGGPSTDANNSAVSFRTGSV
jgi:hypothetical protein